MMSKVKLHYFPDRKNHTDLPVELIARLRELGCIRPDKTRVHFSGFVSFGGDQVAVFLPRNFDKSSSVFTEGRSARLLLLALRRFYKDKNSAIYEQDSDAAVVGGASLSLVMSLLEDYQNNGVYVRRVKIRTKNSGKINWPRTIARSTVFTSPSGPAYLDLETTRSQYTDNSEASRIHASVIKSLLSVYAPILYGNRTLVDERLEQLSFPKGVSELSIPALEKELALTFSERDIFLLKSLIKFLRQHQGKDQTSIFVGTCNFHHVWEAMLDQCLDGNEHVNSILPSPVYQMIGGGFKEVSSSSARTDTVLKSTVGEVRYAVVDAKYYNANSVENSPGWPDLVKQFYYQKLVVDLFKVEDSKVTNHFVFPGSSPALKSAHVAERGKKIIKESDCLPKYSPVQCHYQEPLELLDCYVNNRNLPELMGHIFP